MNSLYGQILERTNILFIENENELLYSQIGGLDNPMFYECNVNNDELKDLFIYDPSSKSSFILETYLIEGEYIRIINHSFSDNVPKLGEWAVIADYNNDDIPDILTNHHGYEGKVKVFKGKNESSVLSFEAYNLIDEVLFYTDIDGNIQEMFISQYELPAWVDIDNDGDLDIAVARVGIFEDQPGPYDTYQLLENISENDHGFLTIYPRNSFGSIPYGLEVSVYSEGDSLTRILYSGGSYASQSELKLHFGLGLKNFVDSIKMLWPDGERLIFEDVPINENLFVHQQEKLLLIMGCMDESSPSFNPSAEYALSCSAELSTNLEKITKNELFTYPNPVIDELYINNSGQSMITDIHIYNTKGQKMYTTQINRSDEHITLNCSWLNSGNYYFSIGNQSGEIIAFQAMKE